MIRVRRHVRITSSGRRATVRAHQRDSGGDGAREVPGWVQPVPVADEQFRAMFLTGAPPDEDGDWWDDDPPAGHAVPDGPPPATLRVEPANGGRVDWAAPGTSANQAFDEAREASRDGQRRTVVRRMPDGTLAPLACFRDGNAVPLPGTD